MSLKQLRTSGTGLRLAVVSVLLLGLAACDDSDGPDGEFLISELFDSAFNQNANDTPLALVNDGLIVDLENDPFSVEGIRTLGQTLQ